MQFIKSIKITQDVFPFTSEDLFEFKPGINLLTGDQGCGKSTLLRMIRYSNKYEVDLEKAMKARGVISDEFVGKKREISDEFADVVEKIFINENSFEGYSMLDTEMDNPRNMDFNAGDRNQLTIVKEFLNYVSNYVSDPLYVELKNLAPAYAKQVREDTSELNSDPNSFYQHRMKSHGQTILPLLESMLLFKNRLILLDEPETSLSILSQYKVLDVFNKMVKENNSQLIIATHSPIFLESQSEVYNIQTKKWMPSREYLDSMKPSAS